LNNRTNYHSLGKVSFANKNSDGQILPETAEGRSQNNDVKIVRKGPQNLREWLTIFVEVNREYRDSFKGFFDNHKSESSNKDKELQPDAHYIKNIEKGINEAKGNLTKNATTLAKEGQVLVEEIKETTGIRNSNDVKEAASSMMVLATECISQFIKGYKSGRDEEIDKMLNKYFEGIDGNDTNEAIQLKEKIEERKLFRKRRRKRLRV